MEKTQRMLALLLSVCILAGMLGGIPAAAEGLDAEQVTEAVTEPVTEPTAGAETEPVTEPTAEVETEPVTEPTAETGTEPATEPETESAAQPTVAETEATEEWLDEEEGQARRQEPPKLIPSEQCAERRTQASRPHRAGPIQPKQSAAQSAEREWYRRGNNGLCLL